MSFGPRWMSGGVATAGIVSAIAIPNMLNAIDRARQKRTMADLRTVGIALEAYGIDNNHYPVSEGWAEAATPTDVLRKRGRVLGRRFNAKARRRKDAKI